MEEERYRVRVVLTIQTTDWDTLMLAAMTKLKLETE
jgi:hypothetical protein